MPACWGCAGASWPVLVFCPPSDYRACPAGCCRCASTGDGWASAGVQRRVALPSSFRGGCLLLSAGRSRAIEDVSGGAWLSERDRAPVALLPKAPGYLLSTWDTSKHGCRAGIRTQVGACIGCTRHTSLLRRAQPAFAHHPSASRAHGGNKKAPEHCCCEARRWESGKK